MIQNSSMRKLGLLSTLLCLILFGTSSYTLAQIKDKATFYGGFTYNVVTLQPPTSTDRTTFFYYGLSGGMDYVLLHSNDVVSLGINPNVTACVQFDAFNGLSFLGQAPVYLLARLGAGATPYNEQKFGIGAGIGVNSSFLAQRVQVNSGGQVKINQTFFNPSAVAELSINARNWNYIFRVNWSLYKPTHDIRIGVDSFPFQYGTAGLGILYNF
jgi:hypothetical protein